MVCAKLIPTPGPASRRGGARPRAARTDQAGLTLIEVMIAAVIVVIGLAGLTAMSMGTSRANQQVMNLERAVAFTDELIEELMATQYAGLEAQANSASGCANPVGNPDWSVPPNPETAPESRQALDSPPPNPTALTFDRTVAVQCLAGSNLKLVTVTTTWNDGRNHSVSLQVMRSPDPI